MKQLGIGLAMSIVLGSLCSVGVAHSGTTATVPREHIVFIVLENHEYSSVTSSSMPYLTSEAAKYVKLTNSYAVRHPSLPNYMTLTGGDTFFTSDCYVTDSSCRTNARNLVDQFDGAGVSWKAYMETMPSPCYKFNSYGSSPIKYVARHNPFMHYNDVYGDSSRCGRVVPLTQLDEDLQQHALPEYAFVTPNLCNDAHSCSLGTADRFLASWVPKIEPELGSTGVIFLTFDEGSTNASCCQGIATGGHIYTAILGPGAKTHTTISTTVDAYSLLATVEQNWNLPFLGKATQAPQLEGWQS
jgi:phosphatidylinositol-3-phosphatase